MQSGNPALKPSVFERINAPTWNELEASQAKPAVMTTSGTSIKTGILLAICVASALWAWNSFAPAVLNGSGTGFFPWLLACALGCTVLSLIMMFKPATSPYLAPIYAAAEGVVIATVSLVMVIQVSQRTGASQLTANTGMIFQAAALTFGIGGAALIAYASGIIRLGTTALKILSIAVGGIFVYGLALLLLNGFFGMNLPNLWTSASPLGIGFSVLVIGLASFTLVADYQMIDQLSRQGSPKYMEWYGAFGLILTLVWLYLEMLRLLQKIAASRN